MNAEPRTGRVASSVDLRLLKADDMVSVQIDELRTAANWRIKIISVDPMLTHRTGERWITGLHRNIRSRALFRAASCQES